MNIARPADGFYMQIPATVHQLIAARSETDPAWQALFDGAIERLKMTGHRIGEPSPHEPGGRIYRASDGNLSLRFAYRALGDTLSITAVG